MKTRLAWLAACVMAAGSAFAQDDDRTLQRLDEERRQDLEKIETERHRELEMMADEDQDLFVDYGGWLRSELIQFDNEPTRSFHRLRFYDLRLWASLRTNEIHRLYVRGLLQLNDYNSGHQFRQKEDDWRGPNLDQGFYELDLVGAGAEPGLGFRTLVARAGRQFMQIGRGITLNSVLDGVNVEGQTGFLGIKLLAGHSITSNDDIDKSRPNADESRRLFYGSEVGYLGIPRWRIFGYGLIQRDANNERPDNTAVKFDYDSEYWGLGLRGEPIPRVSLQSGVIYETGHSHAVAVEGPDREKIFAQSFNLLVQALPKWPTQPRFSLEYLWGSGDGDRRSVTNTVGGNKTDSVDRGFLPMGYINTGSALFPRLSNLHIYRAGVAFRPLEDFRQFEKLEVSADLFAYRKDHHSGGISDLRADVADRDIGEEIDMAMTWRAASDLIFAIRYGRFLPGKAYSNATDQNRDFVGASVTYSF